MLKVTTTKVATILALAVTMGTASMALAQTNPSTTDYGQHGHHYRHVRGPAYGRPGQPLGPAYMGTVGHERTTDPSTCGPGLCQDDPRY